MNAVITRGEWLRNTKVKKCFKERVAGHLAKSSLKVVIEREEKDLFPRRVWIVLSGELAAVPNMKGHKLPGLNCIDPVALAKLRAMDSLFLDAVAGRRFRFYDERIAAVVICGKRSRKFDCDNVLTTVKDWLEPTTKRVGRRRGADGRISDRGWGIGIINDDNQITGFAVHAEQIDLDTNETFIMLMPWQFASSELKTFLGSLGALEPVKKRVELLGEPI